MEQAQSSHRIICYELLASYRQRGQMLLQMLMELPGETFTAILKFHNITVDASIDCMLIHLQWDDMVEAERWNHHIGRAAPSTPTEMMRMLNRWLTGMVAPAGAAPASPA